MFTEDDLCKLLEKHIRQQFTHNYSFHFHTQKYQLADILKCMSAFLKLGIPYSFNLMKIPGKTVYFHYQRFLKAGIFKKVYIQLLHKYSSTHRTRKFKYVSVDSSMFNNLNGMQKAKRNPLVKSKKVTKLSALVDVNGIPFSLLLADGTKSDVKIASQHFDDLLIRREKLETIPKYFLADAGYDCKDFKEMLKENAYTPIIWKNRRNSKAEIVKMNKTERKHYKKRICVENYFCKLKKFRRLLTRVDRYENTFMNYIYLASSIILIRRFL